MKKIISVIVVVVAIISIFSGCVRTMNNVTRTEPHFKGEIKVVLEDYVVVNINPDDPIYQGYKTVFVSKDVELKDSYSAFKLGHQISVYYDGKIKGNNPAKVETVYAIFYLGPGD